MMVNALGIFGVFFVPAAMVVLIVWLSNNAKTKRYQLQADLYAKAIEKGQSVPTDWFVEPKKQRNPLNTGIICIAVGLGIALFLWLAGDVDIKNSATVGFIPFFIGVAFVVIHFIEKKKTADEIAK